MHAGIEVIGELFDYMQWGDRLVLAAASELAEEEYHRHRGISAGSVHALLVHGMAAQRAWLTRWRGQLPGRLVDEADYPARAGLAER